MSRVKGGMINQRAAAGNGKTLKRICAESRKCNTGDRIGAALSLNGLTRIARDANVVDSCQLLF